MTPAGRPAAVAVNVMYERWAPGVAPGLGPMGNPLGSGLLDHQALSWAAYGWRTGVWALLDLLADAEVTATFHVSGLLAAEEADSVRAIAEAGHEVSAHGWTQDRLPPALTDAEERDELRASVEALTAATGRAPTGWVSPRCTPSHRTAALAAEAGLRWFGDVFDSDEPYDLQTPSGPIVGLPFGLDVNDLPQLVRYGRPARDLVDAFTYVADGWRDERTPGYVDVTVHAHVGGRPAGRRALRELIAEARARDCRLTTRSGLIDR